MRITKLCPVSAPRCIQARFFLAEWVSPSCWSALLWRRCIFWCAMWPFSGTNSRWHLWLFYYEYCVFILLLWYIIPMLLFEKL